MYIDAFMRKGVLSLSKLLVTTTNILCFLRWNVTDPFVRNKILLNTSSKLLLAMLIYLYINIATEQIFKLVT